jgi:hypothetical protein
MTDDPDLSLSTLFGTKGGKAYFKPLEEPPDPG